MSENDIFFYILVIPVLILSLFEIIYLKRLKLKMKTL